MKKKILMLMTNVSETATDIKTGVWLEEFKVPYFMFLKEDYDVTVVSPDGGEIPIDPESMPENPDKDDLKAVSALKDSEKLNQIDITEFDALVVPGGHGAMFDLSGNTDVAKSLGLFCYEGKIVAAICHGVAALISVRTKENRPFVEGKNLTGFSNEEEKQTKYAKIIPFSLEDKLREEGAKYSCGKPFESYVTEDDNLITGQNVQSVEEFTKTIITKINELE